jgi:hypothetical protein
MLGSLQANPEYEYHELNKAALTALHASLNPEPLLVTFVVPKYNNSYLEYLHNHPNAHLLCTIPKKSFSFSNPEAWSSPNSRNPGTPFDTEIIIISNTQGRKKYMADDPTIITQFKNAIKTISTPHSDPTKPPPDPHISPPTRDGPKHTP